MIEFTSSQGAVVQVGYEVLIRAYKERYQDTGEVNFVINMIKMLDEWESEKGLKFKRVSGDDWQQLLKVGGMDM